MFACKSYLKLGGFSGTDFLSLIESGYELVNCEFSFQQGVDQKGQPFTQVHGGTFSLILPMMPPKPISEWALNSHKFYDGVIVVLNEKNEPMHKIVFSNAACVGMSFSYSKSGKGYMTTTIVIQAEEMRFGEDMYFYNNWTLNKKEK